MMKAKESKRKGRQRSLVQGVGVNDADYVTQKNNPSWTCPYYRAWSSMLVRAYCQKYQAKCPTYIGCEVTPEWLIFSAFKAWMEKRDWKGKHLDKDIIIHGNKIYSPENCCFVSGALNKLLIDASASCGDYPIGATWDKEKKKFRAFCSDSGKPAYLGYFRTAEEAHQAWRIKKAEVIRKAVAEEDNIDPRAAKSLLEWADKLEQKGRI